MRCPFFCIFLDRTGGFHLFRGGLVAHQGLKAIEDLGALGTEQGQVLRHEERRIIGQLNAFDGGLDDLDAVLLLDLGELTEMIVAAEEPLDEVLGGVRCV